MRPVRRRPSSRLAGLGQRRKLSCTFVQNSKTRITQRPKRAGSEPPINSSEKTLGSTLLVITAPTQFERVSCVSNSRRPAADQSLRSCPIFSANAQATVFATLTQQSRAFIAFPHPNHQFNETANRGKPEKFEFITFADFWGQSDASIGHLYTQSAIPSPACTLVRSPTEHHPRSQTYKAWVSVRGGISEPV